MSTSQADLIVAQNGKPWKKRETAENELARQKLDPAVFTVIDHEGGFAIADARQLDADSGLPAQASGSSEIPRAPSAMTPPAVSSRPVQPPADLNPFADSGVGVVNAFRNSKDRYFLVKFQDKSSEQDLDYIPLSVNTDVIVVRRGEPVILPEAYLEAADHAIYRRFRAVAGQARKIETTVKRFPYERIREVSREDFVKAITSGNAQRDIDLASMEAAAQGSAAQHAAMG